jgi:hypothetical protein
MSNPYASQGYGSDSRGGSHHYHGLDRLRELNALDDHWTVEYIWLGAFTTSLCVKV